MEFADGDYVFLMWASFVTDPMEPAHIYKYNTLDLFRVELHKPSVSLCSDVSLQLFLAMSLMSLQLWDLADSVGPLLVVLMAQMSLMAAFAVFVVFPAMGPGRARKYARRDGRSVAFHPAKMTRGTR